MTIVTTISREYNVITGFYGAGSLGILSMYLYPGDIWFSDKISQGGNHEIVNSLTHLFK